MVMCRVLAVSESGDDAWLKHPVCQRKREDAQLTKAIEQVFPSHHGRYGSPRLHAELRDQGKKCSRKRVARLMGEAGISAKSKRRRVVTTRRDITHPVAPNLFNREFTATEPNTKWVTDITSSPTAQGWLSLAVVLDLYWRLVVGWSMSAHCDEELAANALHMAQTRRRPRAGRLASQGSRLPLDQSSLSPDCRAICCDHKHVAQRQLLGQRSDGEFFRHTERGMCRKRSLCISRGSTLSTLHVPGGVV